MKTLTPRNADGTWVSCKDYYSPTIADMAVYMLIGAIVTELARLAYNYFLLQKKESKKADKTESRA